MSKFNATNTPVIKEYLKLSLGSPIGQLRAIPVSLGKNAPSAVLVIYCADFDVDPNRDMFFFPTDTLKMVLFTQNGEILWKRDLGKAVVPGVWFCPVFAFDLDGDGKDEIWFVNNLNSDHPLSVLGIVLRGLMFRTAQQQGSGIGRIILRGMYARHTHTGILLQAGMLKMNLSLLLHKEHMKICFFKHGIPA